MASGWPRCASEKAMPRPLRATFEGSSPADDRDRVKAAACRLVRRQHSPEMRPGCRPRWSARIPRRRALRGRLHEDHYRHHWQASSRTKAASTEQHADLRRCAMTIASQQRRSADADVAVRGTTSAVSSVSDGSPPDRVVLGPLKRAWPARFRRRRPPRSRDERVAPKRTSPKGLLCGVGIAFDVSGARCARLSESPSPSRLGDMAQSAK